MWHDSKSIFDVKIWSALPQAGTKIGGSFITTDEKLTIVNSVEYNHYNKILVKRIYV